MRTIVAASVAAFVLLPLSATAQDAASPAAGPAADSPAAQAPVAAALPPLEEIAAAPNASGFLEPQVPGELLSADLVGMPLQTPAGRPIGTVTDILIDPQLRLAGIVVEVGEAADRRSVAIPFDALAQTSGAEGEVLLIANIDLAALPEAPDFVSLRDQAQLHDNQDLAVPGSEAEGGSVPPAP
jgi:hypothetical protein